VRRQLLAKLQDLSTAQHTTHTDDHAALVISTGAAGCPAEQPESERQGVHGLGQAKSHGSTQADHGATSSADGSTTHGAGDQLTCPLLAAHTTGLQPHNAVGAAGIVDGQWQGVSWGLLMGALSGVCAGRV
jgi:hypothetical protein